MRSILIFSLLVLSLFPACKRTNEHTQTQRQIAKCPKKQIEALPCGSCELVDRSNLSKGAACFVGVPVVLGAGAGLSSAILGSGCYMAAGVLSVIGIAGASVVGAVFLLCKGGQYLAQHARANKERERSSCKVCKKNHTEKEVQGQQDFHQKTAEDAQGAIQQEQALV